MSVLDQYKGLPFSEIFSKETEGVYLEPSQFEDRVVTTEDIAAAFPQSLTGLINTAASRYSLIDESVGILDEF